ncbi:serine hydrolase [Algibacter marinivivus]|uniref:Serine hydrolase n=1 Tax=Algibacter marinivivus TaxID=2100723 RepID=A0A2U2X5Q7_9FLAO|nr:serine hydrolase domain-containing protein [Algibacter marinivivus]PWH83084.1 serine hydrolase [Algibacter marinivivus]
MKKNYLLLIAFVITVSCISQNKFIYSEAALKKIIDKNVNELLTDKSIRSVAIGVYLKGNEFSAYYGELDKEKNNAPNDGSIYSIASITKTMTGLLAARAVLDDKFYLEDDIRQYLKGDYKNLSFNNHPIKIKHLLTHTSGLPAELVGVEAYLKNGDINGALNFVENYKKDNFFKDLKRIKINKTPGTEYVYSSNGTNLLGYILENVYKMSYELLLKKYIFKPSEMDNTKLELSDIELQKLTKGHDGQGNTTPNQPRFHLGADGYLKSTIPDLQKYMKFLLNDKNVVAQESWKKVTQNTTPMGYFWHIENDNKTTIYKHAGTAIGTTSWLIICPKNKIGISMIINSRFSNSSDLLYSTVKNIFHDINL